VTAITSVLSPEIAAKVNADLGSIEPMPARDKHVHDEYIPSSDDVKTNTLASISLLLLAIFCSRLLTLACSLGGLVFCHYKQRHEYRVSITTGARSPTHLRLG
jgi:hypothetical protein